MIYDLYTSEFERIVSLADRLIHGNYNAGLLVLSFDIGVIAPLLFVILKCRVLRLRKKAIALLKQAPDREGIWHRDAAIECAEWKVHIEELGRGDLPETFPLPQSARIYQERRQEKVIDGELVTVVRFKRHTLGPYAEPETVEMVTEGKLGRSLGGVI